MVMYETESIFFLASKIWSLLPQEIKNCHSLYSLFKKYNEMKTNLSMSVMQNSLATYCFFIKKVLNLYLSISIYVFPCHVIIINCLFSLYLTFCAVLLKNYLLHLFPQSRLDGILEIS